MSEVVATAASTSASAAPPSTSRAAIHSTEVWITKAAVPSNPLVGRLSYHEFRYERAGASKDHALSSHLRVSSTTEVMEMFRFDGSRWVY